MTKRVFSGLKASLEEAVAYARGDQTRGIAHEVKMPLVDVRAARKKLGMSQADFSAAFEISLPTLRKWEQKQRRPSGPARVLMLAIDAEPEAMKRLLAGLRAKYAAAKSEPKKRRARSGSTRHAA